MEQLTLVTAYIDLASAEKSNRTPSDSYFSLGAHLLRRDMNMVIFIEEKNYKKVLLLREKYLNKTKIITVKLDDLPYIKKGKFKSRKSGDIENPEKDTDLYKSFTWCKLDFIKRVLKSNPFDSKFFAWVDFGIYKVVENNIWQFRVPESPELVCFQEMEPTFSSDIEDLVTFCDKFKHNLPAGYFSGTLGSLTWFIEEFDKILDELIVLKCMVHEQTIFAILAKRNYHRISLTFGHYNLLSPYQPTKISFRIAQIWKCIHAKEWDHGLRMATFLYNLKYEDGLNSQVLELLFLCAYYSDNKEICRCIAEEYLNSSKDPETLKRIRMNLSFLSDIRPWVRNVETPLLKDQDNGEIVNKDDGPDNRDGMNPIDEIIQ